jgi:hypothetical protein
LLKTFSHTPIVQLQRINPWFLSLKELCFVYRTMALCAAFILTMEPAWETPLIGFQNRGTVQNVIPRGTVRSTNIEIVVVAGHPSDVEPLANPSS